MARLLIYGVLIGFFGDALRRAVLITAGSLIPPLLLILGVLVWLTCRHWRRLTTPHTPAAPRPKSGWPPQRQRPLR